MTEIGERIGLARSMLKEEEHRNQRVVELATLACLAVHIEPELLRAIRLDAAPHLDAGVEADLWFSSLVESRGPDGIVLHAEIAAILRDRLRKRLRAAGHEPVKRAWAAVERHHPTTSPALALEERIAWLAIQDDKEVTQEIEAELGKALVALAHEQRTGIADWLVGAWARLPAEARRSQAGWLLTQVAAPILGTSKVHPEDLPEDILDVDLSGVLGGLDDVELGVRFTEGVLELGDVPGERAVAIHVPDTDPRVIEVRWRSPAEPAGRRTDSRVITGSWTEHREVVRVPAGGTERLETGVEAVRLRTARGAIYEPYGIGRSHIPSINEPPRLPPHQFQDRTVALERLRELVGDPSIRLVAVVGRDGIGKTAVVSRLFDSWRTDPPPPPVDAFVYLPALGPRPVTSATLLTDLRNAVPNQRAAAAGTAERPNESASTPTEKLDEVLRELAGTRVLLVVDNVETLLDANTALRDPGLDEVVKGLLFGRDHAVKLMLVTREAPDSLLREAASHAYRLDLDVGLPRVNARRLLVRLDADGRVGLASGSEEDLERVYELTDGHPRALEALYSVLASGSATSMAQLLNEIENIPAYDVLHYLISRMFDELRGIERLVVQALAVYGRPVLPAAVDYLLQEHLVGDQSEPILHGLAARRLIQKDGDWFYLPPAPDGQLVVDRIPPGRESERDRDPLPVTRAALYNRAAEYFRTLRKSRVMRIDDLSPQFAEIDLRMRGKDYWTALRLIDEIDQRYLEVWGQSDAVAHWRTELVGKLDEPGLAAVSRELADLLVRVPELYLAEVAQTLGDVPTGPARPEWVADRLISLVVREGLDPLVRIIRRIAQVVDQPAARRLVELLAPLWVNSLAAAEVAATASRPPGERVTCLNTSHVDTASMYIRRAYLGQERQQPVTVFVDDSTLWGEHSDFYGEHSDFYKEVLRALGTAIGFPERYQADIRLEEIIDRSDTPVFVVVPLPPLDSRSLDDLRQNMPSVTILLLGGLEPPDLDTVGLTGIPLVRPLLRPGEEDQALDYYQLLLVEVQDRSLR
jgi:hypothetical protein